MRGYNVYYPMGFDDNGFPTERFVEQKHGIDKSKISKADFIKLCLEETSKGAKTYKDLWTKLGISVDWSRTYSTINPLATKVSQWSLIDLYKKGYLYRAEAQTCWCPNCQTTLAQADIETDEKNPQNKLGLHERCNTPVELKKSKQWFIKIKDNKEKWLELGKKINWYPEHMRTVYETWVNSLEWDWCISRQRYYGEPFPIWYCTKCEEPVFADEKQLPVNPLETSPALKKCPKCGNAEFRPEEDVMDTWATSSSTPLIIAELAKDVGVNLYPATLRPNAFEIIRTWDFYSLVKAYYNFGELPFTNIMVSGHGLDEKGRKIAKRLGNYIPSEELLETYGADAIRYWATGATLGSNHRFSIDEIKKGEKTTIKLWNAMRFISMNLDESFSESEISKDSLSEETTKIVGDYNKCLDAVTTYFDSYEYAKARNEIDSFFWGNFADIYIEYSKTVFSGTNAKEKKVTGVVLYKIFRNILKMYAPIMPYITDELYMSMYGTTSIHLDNWAERI